MAMGRSQMKKQVSKAPTRKKLKRGKKKRKK